MEAIDSNESPPPPLLPAGAHFKTSIEMDSLRRRLRRQFLAAQANLAALAAKSLLLGWILKAPVDNASDTQRMLRMVYTLIVVTGLPLHDTLTLLAYDHWLRHPEATRFILDSAALLSLRASRGAAREIVVALLERHPRQGEISPFLASARGYVGLQGGPQLRFRPGARHYW